MVKPNDLSRSRVALEEDSTLIAVIEMSLGSWLVAGRIPGVDRNPLRKQDPDPDTLLIRLHQWRDEAVRAGHPITRIAVAFEAGDIIFRENDIGETAYVIQQGRVEVLKNLNGKDVHLAYI